MLDPMITRLAGCVVFAGLFAGLLGVVALQDSPASRETVKVAQLQKQIEAVLFTRP